MKCLFYIVYQQFFTDFKFVSPIQPVTYRCKRTGISKLKLSTFLKIMGRKLKKAKAPGQLLFINLLVFIFFKLKKIVRKHTTEEAIILVLNLINLTLFYMLELSRVFWITNCRFVWHKYCESKLLGRPCI